MFFKALDPLGFFFLLHHLGFLYLLIFFFFLYIFPSLSSQLQTRGLGAIGLKFEQTTQHDNEVSVLQPFGCPPSCKRVQGKGQTVQCQAGSTATLGMLTGHVSHASTLFLPTCWIWACRSSTSAFSCAFSFSTLHGHNGYSASRDHTSHILRDDTDIMVLPKSDVVWLFLWTCIGLLQLIYPD